MSRFHGVILGSGRGRRRLDGAKSLPMPLIPSADEKPVLDWILAAFRDVGITSPVFVGGYHLEKVLDHYPDLRIVYHRHWDQEGEAAALLHAPIDDANDVLVVRADTVLLPAGIAALRAHGGAAVAGYHGAGKKFSGVMLFSGSGQALMDHARAATRASAAASLTDVLGRMDGVGWVDLTGLATPVDDPQAMYETIFAGKGRTLEQLAAVAKSAVVLEQERFTTAAWKLDQAGLVAKIRGRFSPSRVIIRSCTRSEDRHWATAAGAFHSELDVPAQDAEAIVRGVEKVIGSYAKAGRAVDPDDEVLVQPQLEAIGTAGVIFTRDPNSGAPYFVLNVEGSGRSDVVTSGGAGSIETAYISWLAAPEALSEHERAAVTVAKELMALTRLDALDIEFSLGRDGRCYLFQVRPLAVARATRLDLDEDLHALLKEAQCFVEARLRRVPTLLGDRTVLGNMPDWNPAEMLGVTPRPLALSLYQSLIGQRAWSAGRAQIGYRDAGPHPLILAVAGRAYVDVRASLNSFLPAGVDDDTGTKWVEHCIEHLRGRPELHDKLEFDVTITTASLHPDADRARLSRGGLARGDIARFEAALRDLTARVITTHAEARQRNAQHLEHFRASLRELREFSPSAATDASYRITLLLDICRDHGIVPFVVAARKAFIAVRMLRSLAEAGILEAGEVDAIQRSVPTIATSLLQDLARLVAGSISAETFLQAYGHVRPSSYDITSRNYAACWREVTAVAGAAPAAPASEEGLRILERRWGAIASAARTAGLPFSGASHFFAFISECIADREVVKFEFMKGVDLILESVAEFGQFLGIDRDSLSFLHIGEIARYAHDSASGATADRLGRSIAYRRKRTALSEALHVPDVIRSAQDLVLMHPKPGVPNFVTRKRVVAPIVFLDDGAVQGPITGKIAAARAADPGYDWIFGHGIAGLVTEYGGVASHMAIRAAEFGIPAAIGCGNVLYEELKGAQTVELDAANRRLRRLA